MDKCDNMEAFQIFQTWKFWQLACSQYGFNLFARWHQQLWIKKWRFEGVEVMPIWCMTTWCFINYIVITIIFINVENGR